ncbi:hypothetical protein FNJ62_11620 [Streptomyces benahoarensis]|uniref:Uncharacterized protein n=1 Tax=Streptomyces benahoarensis TaxID=2595054 RepID=A0A553ZN68_9ACTN|nr:hypothetical protein FNJ62_11620 [Streptomyces benahoarensis]TSB42900.1 hypothetical protein FNZ23_07485 [Streptomyces benahoarensis]
MPPRWPRSPPARTAVRPRRRRTGLPRRRPLRSPAYRGLPGRPGPRRGPKISRSIRSRPSTAPRRRCRRGTAWCVSRAPRPVVPCPSAWRSSSAGRAAAHKRDGQGRELSARGRGHR